MLPTNTAHFAGREFLAELGHFLFKISLPKKTTRMATSDFKNMPATIPAELRNQLPIFQVLGDRIPSVGSSSSDTTGTAKPRSTFDTIVFWALILGGAYWFASNINNILTMVETTMRIVIFSIVILILVMLAPKIISFLHRLGTMILF